jgi:hypothetical protein
VSLAQITTERKHGVLHRDKENNRISSASTFPASPHWMMNRVICSIVDVSSCPENLVKSGTLNLGGNGI